MTAPEPLIRHTLTDAEMETIHQAISEVDSPDILPDVVFRTLFTVLLAPLGESLADYGPAHRLHAHHFAIPHTQWHRILEACAVKADMYGARMSVMFSLVRVMPQPEVQPVAMERESTEPPEEFTVTITRDAAATIDTCTVYCALLAQTYGPHDTGYHITIASWLGSLSRVLSTPVPELVRVAAAGPLSLRVAASHQAYTIIFHPEARRCMADNCLAVIDDDGHAWTHLPDDPMCPDGHHEPTFPVDAPHPGTWAVEY